MIIKNMVKEDIPHLKGFQLENWPDIIPEFKFYIQNSFTHPVKIIDEEKIVGIGCALSFGKTAWLGHIIVDEKNRNKGVGRNLLEYLCTYLENKGALTISLISTPGAFKFYQKMGFRVDTEYIFLEGQGPLESKAAPEIEKLRKKDQEEVLKLDKSVCGENRRRVLKDYLKNSYTYQDSEGMQGYYLPHLGEGLIISPDEIAGLELMKLRCQKKNQGVLPVDNTRGVNFLLDNDFQEIRRINRMVRGEDLSWDPSKVFNRISGNMG